MHLGPLMPETHRGEPSDDLPLDFTGFLSHRLGVERDLALSVLGAFLLEFEPSHRPPGTPSHRAASQLNQ